MKFYFLKTLFSLFLFSLLAAGMHAQQTVTGTVTDEVNSPLPGVTVVVKGTSNGAVTDFDGTYSITLNADDTTLVFSYLGFKTQEIAFNGNARINVTMQESATQLQDVFVSATRRPVRKIETTTATQSISSDEIENLNATGLVDIVKFTPGVFSQNQAGRVRSQVFIRGFPDASSNGLVYTSIMIDGVKTFASTEAIPDASFRNDLNIGKVEVVRGSAATLYGRGAAAGAINVISRTGGEKHGGTIRTSLGDNQWFQVDANFNGPLSKDKTWRYNVGGFWLTDDGYREGLIDDKGGQLRLNVDKIFNNGKGNLRLYGGVVETNVNNYLDIPYAINDLTQPANGFSTEDVVLQTGNPFEGQDWRIERAGLSADNEYEDAIERGNGSSGFNFGANLDLDLGNGFGLSTKHRYQDINIGIGFDIGINNVGGNNSPVNTFGDNQLRAIIGGGFTDNGHQNTDIVNELRFTKLIEGGKSEHNLTLGGFVSLLDVDASSHGALYFANIADADDIQYNINPFFPGIFALDFRNTRNQEDTFSVFVGDEMKFNDKLTISAGARYDAITLNFVEDPNSDVELTREEKHSGVSFSVGGNYLFDENTALYGNASSSYRAPDFGTYSPLRPGPTEGSFDKPRIEENEIVTSVEVGFRKSAQEYSFEGGVFFTDIANRRVATFIGAIATQVPAGDNRIFGSELSFIYTPTALPGFFARTNLTLQASEYRDLVETITFADPGDADNVITETIDLQGNDLANVPPLNWNVSLGYSNKHFGLNVNNSYVSERPIDPYNTVDYPAKNLMDANVYWNINKNLRFKVSATNLLNSQVLASALSVVNPSAPTLLVAERNGNTAQFANIQGVPLLPRRIWSSLELRF